jgi:hypothetical protein
VDGERRIAPSNPAVGASAAEPLMLAGCRMHEKFGVRRHPQMEQAK